jgi:hypothetical protein
MREIERARAREREGDRERALSVDNIQDFSLIFFNFFFTCELTASRSQGLPSLIALCGAQLSLD